MAVEQNRFIGAQAIRRYPENQGSICQRKMVRLHLRVRGISYMCGLIYFH
jgi:hypothetical protein